MSRVAPKDQPGSGLPRCQPLRQQDLSCRKASYKYAALNPKSRFLYFGIAQTIWVFYHFKALANWSGKSVQTGKIPTAPYPHQLEKWHLSKSDPVSELEVAWAASDQLVALFAAASSRV